MAPIPAGPDFPETSAFVRDDARVIRIRPGRYPSLWQICQVLESEMERGFGGSNLVIAGGILGLTHTTEHFLVDAQRKLPVRKTGGTKDLAACCAARPSLEVLSTLP